MHESTDPDIDWTAEVLVCRACQAVSHATDKWPGGTSGLVAYALRDD